MDKKEEKRQYFLFPTANKTITESSTTCSYLNNHIFQQYLKKIACLVLRDLFPRYGGQEWSDFFWIYLCCRVENNESSFIQVKF